MNNHYSVKENYLEHLLGAQISETKFNESEIVFYLKNGSILTYYAHGDCCSSSYIEDIDDVDVLQDCTILGTSRIEGEVIEDGD